MQKYYFLFIFLFILFFYSCEKPSQLESALILAGDNRLELEKVIKYYCRKPADSLKYRAAVFLIENMPYHYSYKGKLLNDYQHYFQELAERPDDEPSVILNSFIDRFGSFSLQLLQKHIDIQSVDSAYLVNNIEWSFKVWKEQPWGKNVSFDNFCEYILPYRIGDEQLAEWRGWIYEKYNPLLDSLRATPEGDDPLNAARVLVDSLCKKKKRFTMIIPNLPHVGPEICDRWMSGSCRELTDLTVYIFRALGIPCGIDYMPQHARVNSGHSWVSIFSKSGAVFTSDYLDCHIHPSINVQHFAPKIYRETFSVNSSISENLNTSNILVPTFFRCPKFVDVTTSYPGYNPILSFSIPKSQWYQDMNKWCKVVYLYTSNRQSWEPIDWAYYNKENTVFQNVKCNVVFRIACFDNRGLVFCTDPFVVKDSVGSRFFNLRNNLRQVNLFSKYDIAAENFTGLMVGGVFEASNKSDFSDSDTLAMIESRPDRLLNELLINSVKKYQYYRYKGASTDSTNCDISEVSFYKENEDIPLRGIVIGSEKNKNNMMRVFDGDTYTSFHSDEKGSWIGLDLGRAIRISKIIYTPRNRDNFVRKGDAYELFYLNNTWMSGGIQIANSDSLYYKDIPDGTLLYLKNHTRGKDERIFTYENGKQVWW